MTPRHAALVLADAAAGGTIDGSDGARVTFEPGSLVDAAGAAVVGAVEVSITPIDVAANVRAFPGKFEGTRPTGQQGLIESYGTAEFILTQGGSAGPARAGPQGDDRDPDLHREEPRRQRGQGRRPLPALVAQRAHRHLDRGRQRQRRRRGVAERLRAARRGHALLLVEPRPVPVPDRQAEAEVPGRHQCRRHPRRPDRHRPLLARRHRAGAAGALRAARRRQRPQAHPRRAAYPAHPDLGGRGLHAGRAAARSC